MMSLRLPPTFMPWRPSSQPGMTCDWPSWKVKEVRPGFRLESNCLQLVSQPEYWTSAFSPDLAASPVPTFSSTIFKPSGYVTAASPLPALQSSAPGETLAEAEGFGLSLATGGLPGDGAG